MLKFCYHGEIIASTLTKHGKRIVTLWNYDASKHPINGFYTPPEPDALPHEGEGKYYVVVGKYYTTITPLKIYRKEKSN